MTAPILVWFRQDLRLTDHPALWEASQIGAPLIPVFIYSNEEGKPWNIGSAAQSWLHHSLVSLQNDLQKKGLKLILRKGESLDCLKKILQESGAQSIYWNRLYEPSNIERDSHIKDYFKKQSIEVKSFKANLIFEPWEIQNQKGKAFQVFTAFWNHCARLFETIPPCYPLPTNWTAPTQWPVTLKIDQLELLPKTPWDQNFYKNSKPGENNALDALKKFSHQAIDYTERRNLPAQKGTSRLSSHLHFGEMSPRQIFFEIKKLKSAGAKTFLKEIFWREFAHHLLFHFPQTPETPLRAEFKNFPWKKNNRALRAWQKGQTGYPIVDAGMRELWSTGWMHNRVRMIVASFLVKDLLIPWQEGAKWFWDTLVDADLANNTLGWQWSAGCGADAAPYFRIFNPVLQGEKFDPQGEYVRKWIPELEKIPDKLIHKPWESTIKTNYPAPLVDHSLARQAALQALASLKKLSY